MSIHHKIITWTADDDDTNLLCGWVQNTSELSHSISLVIMMWMNKTKAFIVAQNFQFMCKTASYNPTMRLPAAFTHFFSFHICKVNDPNRKSFSHWIWRRRGFKLQEKKPTVYVAANKKRK